MNAEEINNMARQYGFHSSDDEAGQLKDAELGEKQEQLAYSGGAQM